MNALWVLYCLTFADQTVVCEDPVSIAAAAQAEDAERIEDGGGFQKLRGDRDGAPRLSPGIPRPAGLPR